MLRCSVASQVTLRQSWVPFFPGKRFSRFMEIQGNTSEISWIWEKYRTFLWFLMFIIFQRPLQIQESAATPMPKGWTPEDYGENIIEPYWTHFLPSFFWEGAICQKQLHSNSSIIGLLMFYLLEDYHMYIYIYVYPYGAIYIYIHKNPQKEHMDSC